MNKRSLKSIVISSLLAIIIIITSVQLFLIYELYQTRNGLTKLVDVYYTRVELSENILNNIQSIGTNLRDALLTYKMGNSKEYIGKVEKLRNETGEIVTKLEPLLTSPAEKDLMEKIKAARSAYIEIQNRIISLLNEGDLEVASIEMATIFPPIYQSYVKAIEDFTAFEEKEFNEDVEEIKHDISILYNTIIYSSIFYIIILIAIAYFTLKAVFKPLGGEPEEVKDILGNVAEGNLSIKIDNPTPDSVMEYTGKMIKELSDVIQRIRASADTISAAAEELNSTSLENKQSIAEQNDRANQIASAAEEMTQTISGIASNASEMSKSAENSSRLASDGKEIVFQTTKEVQSIADIVVETSTVMSQLGDKSKQIGEIANVIRDIADQTNLLALNAAIEAARAGEHGRGFAVVADEVRKLAEKTQSATSEIESMIRGIQKEVDIAVEKMEAGVSRVNHGVELSEKAIESLEHIVEDIDSLQRIILQVASAVEQMSRVSDQVAVDINSLATALNNSSLSADEVINASESLSRLSSELTSIIQKFKI